MAVFIHLILNYGRATSAVSATKPAGGAKTQRTKKYRHGRGSIYFILHSVTDGREE